jgi:CRP/FNR family transcriptional regulator
MEISSFFPFWNKLTPSQQQLLERHTVCQNVAKGTIVHNGSLDCTGLYLIISGQFRIYSLSPEGREITLYRLFDQDICLFSAYCMISSIQFDVIIQAEKDSQVYLVPVMIYKKLMEEAVVVSNYTNELMASRFSDVMWLMEQILWRSFDKRLAAFLLEEADLEGSNVLKITHEAIGNHLGNPREVVTRMLRYFQGEGAVSLGRGSITIADEKKLRAIARV